MIKESIHQEDKTCKYLCTHHRTPKYIKQILTVAKGEIDSNTIIENFNTPLASVEKLSRQNMNKKVLALNGTLDQMGLKEIYRKFHLKATFFSNAHETFSKINHMLRHKTSLDKFKKIEIISSIFSDHNTMKLEINL